MPRKTLNREEAEQKLSALMGWVDSQLEAGHAPRTVDVVDRARESAEFAGLTADQVRARLRLHPSYLMTSTQQRDPARSRKYRSISVTSLGHLHGDICFFGLSHEYEMPPRYRSGALVLRDVLSRYAYAVPLRGSRTSSSMVSAFSEVLRQHGSKFDHKIQSISFDKERSVMSRQVQDFFAQNHIKFYFFEFSSSKAKVAENLIRQIRTTMARLATAGTEKRWWHLLDTVLSDINSRPILVNGRRLGGYAPRDVTAATLPDFLKILHKQNPHLLFNHFGIDSRLVKFKFELGALVRPKLVVTSSAVLGTKRSTVTLEQALFRVTKQHAYLTAANTVGRSYFCERVDKAGGDSHFFDEQDLALSL